MIKILPLKDKEVLARLNAEQNVDAGLAFCLYEGDEMTGYLLYSLTAFEGTILAVSECEDALADGLIRATLASLFDSGIDKAVFSKPDIAVRLKLLAKGEDTIESIKPLLYGCGGGGCSSKCSQCSGCK